MITALLGLGAITIALGYSVKLKNEELMKLEQRKQIVMSMWEKKYNDMHDKHRGDRRRWKQASDNWILEKEQLIEKLTNEYCELKREKFEELHELALMLNDSYYVDEVILAKAEKFDWLMNSASREQKRNFIRGWKVEDVS